MMSILCKKEEEKGKQNKYIGCYIGKSRVKEYLKIYKLYNKRLKRKYEIKNIKKCLSIKVIIRIKI